jgi:hypothetical protein
VEEHEATDERRKRSQQRVGRMKMAQAKLKTNVAKTSLSLARLASAFLGFHFDERNE